MAKCLCCGKTSHNPNAPNWKLWQLCYPCALKLHPEHYEGKPKHGTGGAWENKSFIPFAVPEIKIKNT